MDALELKLAIVRDGRTQREIAKAAGINEVTLSRVVGGASSAQATREKIARALSLPVEELWPQDVAS